LCTSCIVGIFRSNSLFIGSNVRGSVNEGRADFTPIFLSEVPLLFRRKILNLDVALIQVSPPDNHGFCTLGPSVDTTRAAIQNAKFIVGMSVCLRVCLFVGGEEETLCLLKDGSQKHFFNCQYFVFNDFAFILQFKYDRHLFSGLFSRTTLVRQDQRG